MHFARTPARFKGKNWVRALDCGTYFLLRNYTFSSARPKLLSVLSPSTGR